MTKLSPLHSNGVKRVHVGCGPYQIWPDWWNVDIREFPGIDEVMDVTQPWPFGDLQFVYGEHFLQELYIDDAIAFLTHAGNALCAGGVLRVSVPNLTWVLLTHFDLGATDSERVVQDTIKINRAFHGWGHKFLYTREMVAFMTRAMGFPRVSFYGYGESDIAELKGIERHGGYSIVKGAPSVVIFECMRGTAPIRMQPEVAQVIEQDFARYVKYGH